MRILSILICCLFVGHSFAISEGKKGVVSKANKALTAELIKRYSHNFKKNIESYNNKRSNIGSLSLQIKSEEKRRKFMAYTTKHNLKVLPKIIYKNGAAKIKVGQNLIKFSVGTLFDGYMLINGKEVPLSTAEFDSQVNSLKRLLNPKKFSLIDLIINSAHANYDKRYEATLIGTAIIINESFEENSWCYFCEDEYLEASRKNFDKVMKDISKRADDCKAGVDDSEREIFAFQLEELANYESAGYDLREKLNTYFKSYTDTDLTCESMVKKLFSEDIKKLEKKKGFYVSSLRIQAVKEHNAKVYKDFVISKCQPYVELRNCLVDESYTGRTIYNDERKKDGMKRIRSSDSLNETYKPSSTSR